MSPLHDRERVLQTSGAIKTLEIVNRRGLTIPKAVGEATAVLAKLDELSRAADPSAPELPTDVAKVEKAITDAADRRVRATEVRKVAKELGDEGIAWQNAAVIASCSGWISTLCDEFAEKLEVLRELAPTTPRVAATEISNLNPEQFDIWSRCANAIIHLECLADDRETIGTLLGERRVSHWGSRLPLLAAVVPPPDDSRRASDGFRERIAFKDVMAVTDSTTRWFELLQLESRGWIRLGLATANAIGGRVWLANAWREAFESTFARDGGVAFEEVIRNGLTVWDVEFAEKVGAETKGGESE